MLSYQENHSGGDMESPTLDPQLRGNLDIWLEVLKYFEIKPHHDSELDIGTKQKTLLSIALLSPVLEDLTLRSLWRHMTTLEPVVCVINSYASQSTDKFLIYQGATEPKSEFWVSVCDTKYNH